MKHFVCSLALLAALPIRAQIQQPSLLPRLRPSLIEKGVYEVVPQHEPGEMNLCFLTPSECLVREEAVFQQQHESGAQLARRKANLPPGGYLQAFWFRASAARASADKFEFRVTAPGNQQLLRYRAKPTAPHRSEAHGLGLAASYSQLVLIPLPKLPSTSITISVIETATGEKFMFLLVTAEQLHKVGTVTEAVR